MQVHHHSPEQQAVLADFITQTANELIAIEFADPANDAANIRRHAHLSGRLAVYKEMYDDNYEDPTPAGAQE